MLCVGLAIAIGLDTAVQLCWKAAVPLSGSPLTILAGTAENPLFAAAAVLMICQLLNWMTVLSVADVSLAQPITAMGYITVAIASFYLWHETLTPLQVGGIALILFGVLLVSRTHRPQAGGMPSSQAS